MSHVSEDTYLGDVISSDGKNSKNISDRIRKGHGKITEIMNMLEAIPLGHDYFKITILLRESLFLSSILTNSDIWYGLKKEEVQQLEDLDLILLRKILKTPFSVPAEAVYLELGIINIGTLIKARRCNYLHTLVKESESSMLYNFFMAQWNYPSTHDWTKQVKTDLSDFDIPINLDYIKGKSIFSFKSLVKRKAKEFAFFSYLEKKDTHSKLDNIFYRELKIQNYLCDENISYTQALVLFSYRTRMSKYSGNYPGKDGVISCPLCYNHLDLQTFSFQCGKIRENMPIEGRYSNLFSENISIQTVTTVENIDTFREQYISEWMVQ